MTSDSKGSSLQIVLARDGGCSDASVGPVKNDQVLMLFLYTIAAGSKLSAAGTTPGVYSTDVNGAGPYLEADIITTDAACMHQTQGSGKFTPGTVTLTSFSNNSAKGSLSLTSGTDTLTGTFDSEACPALGMSPGTTCH